MGDIIAIILLILVPPIGVLLRVGATKHFWINLLLWIFIPYFGGLLHGIWVFTKHPS